MCVYIFITTKIYEFVIIKVGPISPFDKRKEDEKIRIQEKKKKKRKRRR